jgi:hypothetical protein
VINTFDAAPTGTNPTLNPSREYQYQAPIATATKSSITGKIYLTDLKVELSIIEVQPNMEKKIADASGTYTEHDLSRLSRGWECINNKQYLGVCMEDAKKEGPGMSIFSFLPKEKITEASNCEYHYVERGASVWNILMEAFRGSTTLENYINVDGYDPKTSFLVCVVSPTDDGGTLQRIDVVPFTNLVDPPEKVTA